MRNSEVVASAFLIIGAVCFAQWQRHTPTPQAKFVELRPGLYRLNFSWELHIAAPVPVAVWLVESSPNSWILIDGGTTNSKNQRAILDGIQTTLSSAEDTLRLVLGQTMNLSFYSAIDLYSLLLLNNASLHYKLFSLFMIIAQQQQVSTFASHLAVPLSAVTHGHPDHTGVLGKVLDLYPNIKVAHHEKEEPFLSGGKTYASLPGDNLQFNILKWLNPGINSTLIPSSRALLLQGQSGDVSDVFTYANWLPKGVLEYHAVPGHTPGQVAFYHKSTGSVIAADSFTHISAWWPFSNVKGISLGSPPFSSSVEMVKGSQQNLAVLPGTRTFFPSHDAGNGISAKAIKEFVMA